MKHEIELLRDGLRDRDREAVALALSLLLGKSVAALRRVLLALIVVGCTPQNAPAWLVSDPTLYVTPELADEKPEYAQALVSGADWYCRNGYACVQILIGHGTNEARLVDNVDAIGVLPEHRTVQALTRGEPGGVYIYFFRRHISGLPIVSNSEKCQPWKQIVDPEWIAAHELGHFIGYEHDPDPTNVMYAYSRCGRGNLPRRD